MTAVLLITCPDAKGLVAAVSNLLFTHGANILHADQHQDADENLFFMRVEWQLDPTFHLASFQNDFAPIATRFSMRYTLHTTSDHPRVAIFVSQHLHCLADLLHRDSLHELPGTLALIVSNHPDAAPLAHLHGIPFHHIPTTDKAAAEQQQLALLAEHKVDLVVLARYMQVLSPAFLAHFPSAVINVHHSFLPAFIGARPYHAAFARGVKLIGATAHYATAALDDGPIIEQDVARISHRDSVPDLIARGRDLERTVLARAVRWHLAHRILTYGNKTVVFD